MAGKLLEDRREELRGLFVLGLLAVFASIRIQYSTFMAQIGQLSVDIIPVLNMIIVLWSLYAFFMVLGYSEDVIGKPIAEAFRENSKMFLLFNFILLAIFTTIFMVGGFPHMIYPLGFAAIVISYFVIYRLTENVRKAGRKKQKKRRSLKERAKKIQNYSVMSLLICSTIIVYVQNELVAFSVFLVGLLPVFGFIIMQEKVRRRKTKQQLLEYSD